MKVSAMLAASLAVFALSANAQTSGRAPHGKVDAETATGVLVSGVPSDATAKCNDGTFSKATSKAGACTAHGGLAIWYLDNNAGHPTGEPPARVSNDPDEAVGRMVSGVPSDATAKCKDGTFSKAGKKENACKGSGVSIWYPGS